MNLVKLAGHTVDLDALPERCTVIDVGCRNFDFTDALRVERPDALMIGLDPDPDIEGRGRGVYFLPMALVGLPRPYSQYARFSTGEGNFLCEQAPHYAEGIQVPCMTIGQLMDAYPKIDLLKLDCEGSEFEILENWPGGQAAAQISVEFHDYTDRNRWNDEYFEKLFAGPLRDYKVVQHELTPIGPNNTLGHWDSLLVRK